MRNYYTNKGFKVFNQLPTHIKLIERNIKFKPMVKKLYIKSYDICLIIIVNI